MNFIGYPEQKLLITIQFYSDESIVKNLKVSR
jgi:hypothetical protein